MRLATPTEATIRAWVGTSSFNRGRQYYDAGNIHRPRQKGNVLAAECFGSMDEPYHVEITLDDKGDGLVAGDCSCPVGDGGQCKHAAALLLTWIHAPERFTQLEALTSSLSERSKEELLTIIERMIDRYPDLEDILALPFVSSGQAPQEPVDPHIIRKQIENILLPHADDYGYGYEYDAGRVLRQGLKPLMEIGASYLQHGDWRNAAAIHQTILAELLPQYEMFQDEAGYAALLIDDSVTQLGLCLAAAEKDASAAEGRHSILQTLFEIQKFNIEQGGIGIGDDVPVITNQHATAEEKRLMAQWVQAIKPEDEESWSREWRRQAYGGWLLKLQDGAIDDETYLRICRESGRTVGLVERLLELGRLKEAVHSAQEANDLVLLQLADRFWFHGHAAVATDLVWERAATSKSNRLDEWLKQRAIETGNWKEALKLTEQMYWQRPSVQSYQEVQELAIQLNQWEQRRTMIHARLVQQGSYGHLTEIHLLEDNVAAALESLQQAEGQKQGYFVSLPRLEIAKAAEQTHPNDAIRLYIDEAQKRIKERGRGNYQEAAKLLARVKALYQTKLNADRTWQAFIQQVRADNRTLRALMEELDRAKL